VCVCKCVSVCVSVSVCMCVCWCACVFVHFSCCPKSRPALQPCLYDCSKSRSGLEWVIAMNSALNL